MEIISFNQLNFKKYLTEDRLITENLCFYWTFFRYINAFADWMALGMIAVSRFKISCEFLTWG